MYLACRDLHLPFWQSALHDLSKFRPSEWIPYAKYFYGGPRVGDTLTWVNGNGDKVIVNVLVVKHSKWGGNTTLSVKDKYEGPNIPPFFDIYYADTEEGRTALQKFNIAWNHHQKRNPHHWQYWLLTLDDGTTEALQMPTWYVREMIADWVGAGRAITGKIEVWSWYEKNKKKILLERDTADTVKFYMARLKDKYSECEPSTSTVTPSP